MVFCFPAVLNHKRPGKTIAHKPRPRGDNVVDLMTALKQSISAESGPRRKAPSGQKEMLMSVGSGKKPAKRAAKKTAKSDRRSA